MGAEQRRRAAIVGVQRILSVGVGVGLVAAPIVDASAAQVLASDCNFGFKEVFNKGDAVCVTGDVDIVPPGKILPEAQIFVIPVDNPNPFADISGGVNLVQGPGFGGAFYDEYVWLPELKSGQWELVLDHHPYNTWTATDIRTGVAFTVTDAPTVFSVDPAMIKAAAAIGVEQAKKMQRLVLYLTALDTLSTAADWGLAFGPVGGLVGLALGGICYATGTDCPTSYNSAVITIGGKYIDGHGKSLEAHYQGIVDDPPDPNFGDVVALDFSESVAKGAPHTPLAAQEIPKRQVAAAAAMVLQAGAYKALVPSLEKLQGAQAAKSNLGMLLQAEKVKAYAELALWAGDRMVSELTALETFLQGKGTLESGIAAAEVLADVDTLEQGGLVGDERDQVYSFGFSDADIDAGVALLAATPVPAQLHYGALIDEGRQSFLAVKPALQDLVAQVDKMIAENTPLAVRVTPKASVAMAPAGVVGQVMNLSADATHFDNKAVLTYAWDTDMDGVFDDAMGKSIAFTPTAPGPLVVSVEVVDDAQRRDVAHRILEVAVGNAPPEITSLTPVELAPYADVDAMIQFHVEAVDGDGDPLTITWSVDGAPQGNGPDFAFAMPDEAAHRVVVSVADDHPYSPDARALRVVRASKWDPGGDTSTTGESDSEGTTSESGGTETSGGTSASGGTDGTDGSGTATTGGSGSTDGTGGSASASGGSGSTGGSASGSASGGSASDGGSASESGGSATEATGDGGQDGVDGSGCACRASDGGAPASLALGLLALAWPRRRRR